MTRETVLTQESSARFASAPTITVERARVRDRPSARNLIRAGLLFAATLAALPGTFARTLYPNEDVYLPELFHASGAKGFAADWTLRHLQSDRPLFNLLFWPLGRTGNPGLVSAIGRPLAWLAVLVPLMFLIRRLGIASLPLRVLLFACWLVPYPYTVTREWIIGPFESKTFAYGAMFTMMFFLMNRRLWWAGLFAVIAVGMHNVLGLWTLAIFLAGCLALKIELRQLIRLMAVVGAGALIGLIPLMQSASRVSDGSDAAMRIYTGVLWGFHFDPFQFPLGLRIGFALVCIGELTLVLTHFRSSAGHGHHHGEEWRVLTAAEIVGVLGGTAGFVTYEMNLRYVGFLMPMRIGPVLIPLAGLIRIAHIVSTQRTQRVSASADPTAHKASGPARHVGLATVTGALVLIGGICAPTAIYAKYRLSLFGAGFDHRPTHEVQAQTWVRDHLPETAVVAADPTMTAFATTKRPLIAVYTAAPGPEINSWIERINDLTGIDLTTLDPDAPSTRTRALTLVQDVSDGFRDRPLSAVEMWRTKYGATVAITSAQYELPILAQFGEVKVYDIRGTQ